MRAKEWLLMLLFYFPVFSWAQDTVPPVIYFSAIQNSSNLSAKSITGVEINDINGINISPGSRPRLYYKRSTDVNTYNDNSSNTTGWKYTETNEVTNPFGFLIDYSILHGGTINTGDIIQYFVVAEDNSSNHNLGVNSAVGFAVTPSSVNIGASAFPLNGTINQYSIVQGISGTFYIGASQVAPNYTNLTNALADLATKELTGNVVLNMRTDYNSNAEPGFPIVINPLAGSGPTSRLIIKPDHGNTYGWMSTSSAALALLKINGADYITIDGSNNGTNSQDFTFQTNYNVSSNNSLIWVSSNGSSDGASNIVIKNCRFVGYSSGTSGYGIFSGNHTSTSLSSYADAANSDNSYINNRFSYFKYGICLLGNSPSLTDKNNIVQGNLLGTTSADLSVDALHAENAENLTVIENNIQNLKGYGSNDRCGVKLKNAKGCIVSRNLIHNFSYQGGGSARMFGIFIHNPVFHSPSATSANIIDNNIIYDLYNSSSHPTFNMAGINISGGYSDKVFYNSVYVYGLYSTGVGICAAFANGNTIETEVSTGLEMKNNIFYLKATAGGGSVARMFGHYVQGVNAYSSGSQLSNNLIRGDKLSGGSASVSVYTGYYNSANLLTLANWQSATGVDSTSSGSDPGFNSTINLIPLPNSPAVGNAVNISGFSIDYIGISRNPANPTVGAYENAGDFLPPVITFGILNNGYSSSQRNIQDWASISDAASGINHSGFKPRLYYKKSVNNNTYLGNTSSDNGWKFVEASDTIEPYSFIIDYTLLTGGGVTTGDIIQYFIVAQDKATIPNIAISSSLTFNQNPANVGLLASHFPIGGAIPTFNIVASLPTIIYVGYGQTYTSLTGTSGLFSAINNGALTGNTTVYITSDLLESGVNELLSNGLSGFTLSILPLGNVVTKVSNSGNLSNAMIRFNSVSNITIDGQLSALRFVNTHTVQTSAFPVISIDGGCSNITIKNSLFESNMAKQTSGIVHIGSSGHNTGIKIFGNEFNKAEVSAGVFQGYHVGVYSSGVLNSNLLIGGNLTGDKNTFYDAEYSAVRIISQASKFDIINNHFYYTTRKINAIISVNVSGGDSINILNNHFYATDTFMQDYTAIYLANSASSGHNVSGNKIGGTSPNCQGGSFVCNSGFTGIRVSGSSALQNLIAQNTINQVVLLASTPIRDMTGIYASSFAGTISGNTFGVINGFNASGIIRLGNGPINCIYITSGSNVKILGNYIAGIGGAASVFTGVNFNSATKAIIQDNFISNSGSSFATASVKGIAINTTSVDSSEVTGNRINGLSLTNNAASDMVTGIQVSSSDFSGIIHNNKISELTNTGASDYARVNGIYFTNASAVKPVYVVNNQISLNNSFDGVPISGSNAQLNGIKCYLSNSTGRQFFVCYNSVYIGGVCGASSSASSFCFSKQSPTLCYVNNNIFYNERIGGTAAYNQGNFGIGIGYGATAGFNSSNNLLVNADTSNLCNWNDTKASYTNFNLLSSSVNNKATLITKLLRDNLFANVNSNNLFTKHCIAAYMGVPIAAIPFDASGKSRDILRPCVGAVEFEPHCVGFWEGFSGANTNSTSNWTGGILPSLTDTVYIPVYAKNYPELSTDMFVHMLTVEEGAKISLNGYGLKVTRGINGNGVILGHANSILEIGGTGSIAHIKLDQSIPGVTNRLGSLKINTDVAYYSDSVTVDSTMLITGDLTIVKGKLITNNKITLVSDQYTTAQLTEIDTNTAVVSGILNIERYVPSVTRRYRMVSPNVSNFTFNQLKDDIFITGAGGVTNGFDASTQNSATIYTYREDTAGGRGWKPITNIANSLNPGNGAFVFVRGDRNLPSPQWYTAPFVNQNAVTLDFTNPPFVGAVSPAITYTNTGSISEDGYNLVGNPYASTIDWNKISKNNLSPFYYIYDPVSGSYISDNGSSLIASGQSFFVKATAANPTINFTETCKASGVSISYFKNRYPQIKVAMIKDSLNSDVAFIHFKGGFSKGFVSSEDGLKLVNATLNVSVLANGDSIALQHSYGPFISDYLGDTIGLNITGTNGNYQLQFSELSSIPSTYSVFLSDQYLNTLTNIGGSSPYSFTINSNPASKGKNRFRLLILNSVSLPFHSGSLQAYHISGTDKVMLEWMTNQSYNVSSYIIERTNSLDKMFIKVGEVLHDRADNGILGFAFVDEPVISKDNESDGFYYRVMEKYLDGSFQHSEMVYVKFEGRFWLKAKLGLYPNPVSNGTFYICLEEDAFATEIALVEKTGRIRILNYNQSGKLIKVNFPEQMTGDYYVRVSTSKGKYFSKLIINE